MFQKKDTWRDAFCRKERLHLGELDPSTNKVSKSPFAPPGGVASGGRGRGGLPDPLCTGGRLSPSRSERACDSASNVASCRPGSSGANQSLWL